MTADVLPIKIPEWVLPWYTTPARYKAAHGGRGSSKSWSAARYLLYRHINDGAQSSICGREVQESIRDSVKRLLEQQIEELGVQDYFDIKDAEIRNRHGPGKIVLVGLKSHTAESIKSLEGFDRIWLEEAQSISQRSLDIVRPTLRKAGSEILATWNPRRPTDPIDALLRGESRPDDAIVNEVNYFDNPDFPDVLRREMEHDRSRDPDKYAHVWLGKYESASSARVFRNWRVDVFEAPADAIFRFGADWGFSVDPTVLLRGYVVGRKLFIDYEAVQVGCEIDHTPDLFLTIPEAEKGPIVADSARPETISYMLRKGFRITAAVKGARSVEEGIEFLKGYDIVVHERCKSMINALASYSYKTDPLTGAVTTKLDHAYSDCIDAARYMVEGIRRLKAKPVTSQPAPSVNFWNQGRR